MVLCNSSDELIRQIGEANRKVDNARELFLLHELEANEYREIKEENGSTVARLEMRLNEVNVQKSTHVNIKKLAQMAVSALCEVEVLYDIASTEAKRYLVGILFPEKMTYAEGVCRTGKLNRAAELIYLENKELKAKKMGRKSSEKTSSHYGSVTVRNSNHFVDELIEIGSFSKILDDILIT